MKKVWNILAIIAVANMLAMLGFLGWLNMSDRLDMERARKVREVMARTLTQDKQDEEAKKKKEEEDKKALEEAAKAARSPLTASETLAARAQATELDRERMERLRREVTDLQGAIARERSKLDADRAALDSDKRAFAAEQQRIASTTGTEQFERSLGVLVSLKPAQARSVLEEIMRGGKPEAMNGLNPDGSVDVNAAQAGADVAQTGKESAANDGKLLAVEYLNAMDERARGKIMAEFAKDSPAVAAELLEILRMRGRIAPQGE
jgi:hypothetical protein